MIPKRNSISAFAFGVVATIVLFVALGADQPPTQPAAPMPRYQISSWAFAERDQNTGQGHGAYRVDTHTGEVMAIVGETMLNERDAR